MSDVRLAPVVSRLVAASCVGDRRAGGARRRVPPPMRRRSGRPPDAVVGEADGYVNLIVRLSAAASSAVSVHYADGQQHATAGSFCNLRLRRCDQGTLTFAPGEITKVDRRRAPRTAPRRASFGCSLHAEPRHADQRDDRARRRSACRSSTLDTLAATPAHRTPSDATVDEKDGEALIPVHARRPDGQAPTASVTVDYATRERHGRARARLHAAERHADLRARPDGRRRSPSRSRTTARPSRWSASR